MSIVWPEMRERHYSSSKKCASLNCINRCVRSTNTRIHSCETELRINACVVLSSPSLSLLMKHSLEYLSRLPPLSLYLSSNLFCCGNFNDSIRICIHFVFIRIICIPVVVVSNTKCTEWNVMRHSNTIRSLLTSIRLFSPILHG